jgi:hypothetical protein
MPRWPDAEVLMCLGLLGIGGHDVVSPTRRPSYAQFLPGPG